MKIVVDVVNSEKVKDLTAEIQRQEKQILSWNAAMKGAGATQQAVLQTNMANAGKTIANAKTEIASLESASAGAGRGLGQLSYAIDDIQYGFNAIVNNIPQIVMGLGGSMGLAGAIGIVAVAINQLIKHWSEVTAMFEAGFSNQSYDQLLAVKKAAEEAAESFQKLAGAKSKWEEKSTKVIEEAVTGVDANKLRTAVTATLSAGGEGAEMTDDERRAMESVKNAKPEVKKGVEDRIRKRLQEENAKEAEKIIGGLTSGDDEVARKARDRITHLIDQNREAFDKLDPGLGQKFKESAPEKIKEKEEAEEFAKAKKKIEDKEEEINKKNWQERKHQLEEEKRIKIQGLEDERDEVMKAQHAEDEAMWQRQHKDRAPAQILQGPKAMIDYFQTAGRNQDDPKVLAKEAHAQREKHLAVLKSIDENIKKERRLVVPN